MSAEVFAAPGVVLCNVCKRPDDAATDPERLRFVSATHAAYEKRVRPGTLATTAGDGHRR